MDRFLSSLVGKRPLCSSHSISTAAAAKSLQSCPTLCNPTDGSPPGSSVPGILQARILEWVVISFSNACMHAKLLQSCPTLCDPMDSNPPGSSVHRILQARIVERAAISFCTVLIILYGNFWLTLVSLACKFLRSKRHISFIFACYFLAQCL